MAQQS